MAAILCDLQSDVTLFLDTVLLPLFPYFLPLFLQHLTNELSTNLSKIARRTRALRSSQFRIPFEFYAKATRHASTLSTIHSNERFDLVYNALVSVPISRSFQIRHILKYLSNLSYSEILIEDEILFELLV